MARTEAPSWSRKWLMAMVVAVGLAGWALAFGGPGETIAVEPVKVREVRPGPISAVGESARESLQQHVEQLDEEREPEGVAPLGSPKRDAGDPVFQAPRCAPGDPLCSDIEP